MMMMMMMMMMAPFPKLTFLIVLFSFLIFLLSFKTLCECCQAVTPGVQNKTELDLAVEKTSNKTLLEFQP